MRFSQTDHLTRDLLFLVPLSFYILLYGLGGGSLASWDEAVYASAAAAIHRSNGWLDPMAFADARALQGPLPIWVTALLHRLLGANELSSRLFSALCGVGTVVLTYLLGVRLLSRWAALLAAGVLLSTSHFIRFSRFGMLDSPLTFLLTLALFLFWLGRNRNRHLVLSGIVVGLAVLTKGSSAFMILGIVWVFLAWAERADLLSRSSYWVGLMLAVAIALPWQLYGLYWEHQLRMQPASGGTAWPSAAGLNGAYYLRVLINKYHPWILVGILSGPYFLFRAFKEREEEVIFISSWMLVVFGTLVLSRDRNGASLLALYPALSLTVGWMLSRVIPEAHIRSARVILVVVLLLHIPYSNIFDHDYSPDIKKLSRVIQESPADEAVYLYRHDEAPAVRFYTGRSAVVLKRPEELTPLVSQKHFGMIVTAPQLRGLGGESFLKRHRLAVKDVSGALLWVVTKS